MALRRPKKVEATSPDASTPQETNIPTRRLKPPVIQVGSRGAFLPDPLSSTPWSYSYDQGCFLLKVVSFLLRVYTIHENANTYLKEWERHESNKHSYKWIWPHWS